MEIRRGKGDSKRACEWSRIERANERRNGRKAKRLHTKKNKREKETTKGSGNHAETGEKREEIMEKSRREKYKKEERKYRKSLENVKIYRKNER
ncbi:MAG: hypothetical protein IKU11_02050 [Clostridia bacterium]|nr:hypothetical protein [Clostridia bacterium]